MLQAMIVSMAPAAIPCMRVNSNGEAFLQRWKPAVTRREVLAALMRGQRVAVRQGRSLSGQMAAVFQSVDDVVIREYN